MKQFKTGQGFKTYKGYGGSEFTISRSDYNRMMRGLKDPDSVEFKSGFTERTLEKATRDRKNYDKNMVKMLAEREKAEALKNISENKRDDLAYIERSSNSIMSSLNLMKQRLVKKAGAYATKKRPDDILNALDELQANVKSAFRIFSEEYRSYIEDHVSEVAIKYTDKILLAMFDAMDILGPIDDVDIEDIMRKTYVELIEGRISENQIERRVFSKCESAVSRFR